MSKGKLDIRAAKFEMAFRYIESDRIEVVDKLDHIDVFADYLYPREDEDYENGEINEMSPVFLFIDKMLENLKDCREIVRKELEDRDEYELLAIMSEPVGEKTESVINKLDIF